MRDIILPLLGGVIATSICLGILINLLFFTLTVLSGFALFAYWFVKYYNKLKW
jgi:hypothetical protein